MYEGQINKLNNLLSFIPKEIREFTYNHIKLNDLAHSPDHILEVVESLKYILTFFKLSERDELICYLGALVHDNGCHIDRVTHHLLSAELFEEFKGKGIFIKYKNKLFSLDSIMEEVLTVIKEHRSSFKGVRSNTLSDIVSLADKGIISLDRYIYRSLKYREGSDLTLDEKLEEVNEHMCDKFGPNGYGWNNFHKLGLKLYKDNINEIKTTFRNKEVGLKYLKEYVIKNKLT